MRQLIQDKLTSGTSVADDASAGVSSGMPATTNNPIYATGFLKTTANTGTAQLRFRSEATAVTQLNAGCLMKITKLI